ncbi:MAG TPA: enoyl-CoA hydratase-related protein, partial [Burkholderiales bacterium]|nr:enoyl-CoA hydratase-related protein [Burkholderiales bacterium]
MSTLASVATPAGPWQHILYDQPESNIARITLNRVEKHNAQDTRFLYELNAAFDRAAQDPEVKVIIL